MLSTRVNHSFLTKNLWLFQSWFQLRDWKPENSALSSSKSLPTIWMNPFFYRSLCVLIGVVYCTSIFDMKINDALNLLLTFAFLSSSPDISAFISCFIAHNVLLENKWYILYLLFSCGCLHLIVNHTQFDKSIVM